MGGDRWRTPDACLGSAHPPRDSAFVGRHLSLPMSGHLTNVWAYREADAWPLMAEGFPVLPEWFCSDCHRWVNGLCCPGCLKIDPANVRWASQAEIEAARKRVLNQFAEEVKGGGGAEH